jgi:S1-C subfamily serine protease
VQGLRANSPAIQLMFDVSAMWTGILTIFVWSASAALAQVAAPQSQHPIGARAVDTRVERARTAQSQPGRAVATGRRRPLVPSDDWTYRPTVVIRRGTSQGTGTIIASIDGETLVLTAAHVVRDQGPIVVELHRFNLGVERFAAQPGPWPRLVQAKVAASDSAADLAVLRIEKTRALPYVARLAHKDTDPPAGSKVTSIGIDLGTELAAWSGLVVETLSFKLNGSRDERQFLITDQIPEHGRSGGGLFGDGGELVGVCVGHAEVLKGRRMGVFVSLDSIRLLLEDHKLAQAIARSDVRQARRTGRTTQGGAAPGPPSRSNVTTTRSNSPKRAATGR